MTIDFTPSPEDMALENQFIECVQQHPGITPLRIARKIEIPVTRVRQACDYAVADGTLFVFDGRYFATAELAADAQKKYDDRNPQEDPFFVDTPKLPDLTPPTEEGLDSWEFFYGLLKEAHGLTLEQFAALPKQAQNTIQDAVQATEIRLWRDSENAKGYEVNQENYKAIGAWLNARHAPITQRNLTRAYHAQQKTREQIKQEYLDQLKRDHDKWQN
jgi:hypothetical protein